MAKPRKQQIVEQEPGAPEWMVTFSDCMTLLLTFFVLLLSFSSFDDKVHRQLQETMFTDLPNIYAQVKRQRDALIQDEQINPTKELLKGSETETLVRGPQGNMKQTSKVKSFRDRKVFLISSERIFWGKGTKLSPEGHDILATLAKFLGRVPGRIVISENAPNSRIASKTLGLERSWAVMEDMVHKQAFDEKRLSITANSTIPTENEDGGDERRLEIIILERSITN